MEIKEMDVAEIQNQINSGNMEVINGVIARTIIPATQKQENEIQVSNDSVVVQSDDIPQSTDSQIVEPVIETPPAVDPLLEEVERERKYREMVERRQKEEQERYLEELRRIKDEADKEKRAREELENKLRQLQLLNNERPNSPTQDSTDATEEDEFASDYSRRTRQMVEELKQRVGSENPVVNEFIEEIKLIKAEREERNRQREEEKKKQAQKRVFDEVRDFMRKNPNVATKKDIEELDKEVERFRSDIRYLTKPRSVDELEKNISDYYNGGPVRKLAEENGIKPIEDWGNYQLVSELMDLKRGLKFNPTTGEYEHILNDEGQRVTYRSLDEAFKIKNYNEEILRAHKEARLEVMKKLDNINAGAKTLPPTKTETFDSGLTLEQEKEILSWHPKEYMNNPDRYALVKTVYEKRGLTMPQWRGRK